MDHVSYLTDPLESIPPPPLLLVQNFPGFRHSATFPSPPFTPLGVRTQFLPYSTFMKIEYAISDSGV